MNHGTLLSYMPNYFSRNSSSCAPLFPSFRHYRNLPVEEQQQTLDSWRSAGARLELSWSSLAVPFENMLLHRSPYVRYSSLVSLPSTCILPYTHFPPFSTGEREVLTDRIHWAVLCCSVPRDSQLREQYICCYNIRHRNQHQQATTRRACVDAHTIINLPVMTFQLPEKLLRNHSFSSCCMQACTLVPVLTASRPVWCWIE